MASVMWDLDGIVNNFTDRFHPWFRVKHAFETEIPWIDWHGHRKYGITDETFVEDLMEFAELGMFTDRPPYPGALDAAQRLQDAGHTNHVVTDRPAAAHDGTRQWLDNIGFAYDTLQFSRDKTVFMEISNGPYYGIDDRIENVRNLRAAGVEALLLNWPWNEEAIDLPRVYSLSEFVDEVLEMEESHDYAGIEW